MHKKFLKAIIVKSADKIIESADDEIAKAFFKASTNLLMNADAKHEIAIKK